MKIFLALFFLILVPDRVAAKGDSMSEKLFNVLGTELKLCNLDPLTGFQRDGFCKACSSDPGNHTVCAEVTQAFLDYSASRGNDLRTPHPEYGFAGLKAGDAWCLCAGRYLEAHRAGKAPKVILEATAQEALETIPKEIFFSPKADK